MRRVAGTVTGLLLCSVFVTAARAPSQGAYTVAYASFGPLRTAVFIANADAKTPASGFVRTWLYVAAADGSNPRVLFNDPTQSALAAWAPTVDPGRRRQLRVAQLVAGR